VGTDERRSILPAGTATFLLTGLERPSRWSDATSGAADVVARHRQLIDESVVTHGGARPDVPELRGTPDVRRRGDGGPAGRVARDGVADGDGDGAVAVFASAADAVLAALDIQRAVAAEPWPNGLAPRVRIGLHTGEALLRDNRYYGGAAVDRCARLRDVAHGGQTLLSSVTADLVAEALPDGTGLRDLGPHRLRDLSRPERVFELRHADQPAELPPLRSLDGLANNLPIQLTSFVGRGDELAEVELLLSAERLVTLTGSGGCGKTRLAMQAAAELADRWPDGVWWVDLGPVTDPALAAELVASSIGVLVEPVSGPLRALTLQLRDRRLLVCLDNCEHLLDASAGLAESLLRACPEVSVLATSREPLAVAGETVWRVPSLVEDEAVSLFVERASRVRPWFTLDATSEAAVRTMCRRLDGIPLAIELAAAWLRTLTPAQIAAGLDDRFALLVRGPRSAVARHQTLAASMDWSHDLLDDTHRVVFRRLAAFTGGFALDAARAVAAGDDVADPDVLIALGGLVDKSLVVMDERGGEARYRLLESIRQYGAKRLRDAGETEAVRDRHLDHFLALATAAEPELEDADQDVWLARLEAEHDNLRVALDWGLSAPDSDRGRRLAARLSRLWYVHGQAHEGVDVMRRAVELAPDDRSALQSRLLAGAAMVAIAAGQFPLIAEYAQRGLDIASANGDDRIRGRCLLVCAYVMFYLDPATGQDLCRQARRAAEAAGDRLTADASFVVEGVVATNRDRHDEAGPVLRTGLDRCLGRGDRSFAALALYEQVEAAVLTGDVRLGDRLATRALELAEPLGDYYTVGGATSHLAWVKAIAGDVEGGRRLMEKVVRSVEGAGHDLYVPKLAPQVAKVHLWGGELEQAVDWFRRDVELTGPMADSLIVARACPGLADALRRLGRVDEARVQVDRAIAMARKLDVPHVLAEALEQSAFLVAGDDPDQAEDLHHQALALRVEWGLRTCYVDSLDALASLAAGAESFAEAARLLAASGAAREAIGYPRPPVDRPSHETTVATLRAALGDDDFAAAWREGAALTLDDAVAYARRSRGARNRPSTGWASLTPTELEVVRGVVDGLTNPEIGSRLFMSRGTVKTHLSHVYAKLGIANRTELATEAARRQGTT
jgi:predicted ATPase/class 3 adenylate cyclase/DNA-binding CsgD family transcriptional regulator